MSGASFTDRVAKITLDILKPALVDTLNASNRQIVGVSSTDIKADEYGWVQVKAALPVYGGEYVTPRYVYELDMIERVNEPSNNRLS